MKKQREEQHLFKDKKTEHRVVMAIMLGLALYFGYQAAQYFLSR